MELIKKRAAGVCVCALLALPCWFLGTIFPLVGGPVFAILIGMIIALFWKKKGACRFFTAACARRFSLEWRAARLSSDRPMSARTALQMHYAAGVISVVMYIKQLHHHQGPLYGFSAQG